MDCPWLFWSVLTLFLMQFAPGISVTLTEQFQHSGNLTVSATSGIPSCWDGGWSKLDLKAPRGSLPSVGAMLMTFSRAHTCCNLVLWIAPLSLFCTPFTAVRSVLERLSNGWQLSRVFLHTDLCVIACCQPIKWGANSIFTVMKSTMRCS